MAEPLVSVIIPTYNWSSVLPFSIGSALRQTFTNFEVLVVGDGCTDDSQVVVASVEDDRVRWINLPKNSGHQSEPNNEGLRQARGELIAYLGHDDLWLPHHLSCLTAKIADGYDLAFGVTGVVPLDGKCMVPFPSLAGYERGMWVPPTGIVHRREITAKIGGWRHYREVAVDPEVDLWQRAYDAEYRFVFVPRLTAVKFSAAERRDSYKIRSSVEQEQWTHRINNEPDLEAVELMNMLLQTLEAKMFKENKSSQDVLREFVDQMSARALGRFSRWLSKPQPVAKGETVDQRRKFKGLDG